MGLFLHLLATLCWVELIGIMCVDCLVVMFGSPSVLSLIFLSRAVLIVSVRILRMILPGHALVSQVQPSCLPCISCRLFMSSGEFLI